MTPYQYAIQEYRAERIPSITIQAIAGDFHLGDNDWNLLSGRAYRSRADAEVDRSRILDRARFDYWRHAAA